jgi:hypothetical protein
VGVGLGVTVGVGVGVGVAVAVGVTVRMTVDHRVGCTNHSSVTVERDRPAQAVIRDAVIRTHFLLQSVQRSQGIGTSTLTHGSLLVACSAKHRWCHTNDKEKTDDQKSVSWKMLRH